MKKLFILAISAIMALNMSAQDVKKVEKGKVKGEKKECKLTKEQRIECDIKDLSRELYLSEEQAAKFAVTYREFMAEKEKLNEKYKALFGKDLNERQVQAVLHYRGPKHKDGPKGGFQRGEGPKHKEGPKKKD